MRDEGALETALVAVENRVHYAQADLVGCAAAYAFHLSQAHAFIDGNKRVAAATMEVFLVLHQVRLSASDDDLYGLLLLIADGSYDRSQAESWLRARCVVP